MVHYFPFPDSNKIVNILKKKKGLKSPRHFILLFQSPAETFFIIFIEIGFLPYTHAEYYRNFPFNFLKKLGVMQFAFFSVHFIPCFIIPSVSVIK